MRLILTQQNCQYIGQGHWRYRLDNPQTIKKFLINQFCVYNAFNNVNQNYNSIQISINGGASQEVSLDQDLYGNDAFLDEVQAKLIAAGLTNCAITSSDTNHITITSDLPFNFILYGDSRDRIMTDYLGFLITNAVFTTQNTTHTGNRANNVSLTTCYNFQLEYPQCQQLFDQHNVIFSAPVSSTIYDMVQYTSQNNFTDLDFAQPTTIAMVQFRLLDDQFNNIEDPQMKFNVNLLFNAV